MTRRVYQFGMRPPTEGAHVVQDQLRAAHQYRNDLVAIERGRRSALRAVDDTAEVREAVELVVAATKSSRKAAMTRLREARKAARDAVPKELARIQALDEAIRKDARALTTTFWGTYLDIEAAHNQARSAPLYGDDAVTPSDPRFARWDGTGQLGMQLQGGVATPNALAGIDTRVRLAMRVSPYGMLWLRVRSDGRAPVWALFPVKVHRSVPNEAQWKWVRVSCRREGLRMRWTCEITVDDPAPHSHTLDKELRGAIAVEWEWSPIDDGGIRVARWADDRGKTGEVVLPARIVSGIRKPDGIRAVRDTILNDLRPRLALALRECGEELPTWLREAVSTMVFWKSPSRFYRLVDRWRSERCDAARQAYEMLDAWWLRDAHLYDYEASARGQALRQRRDWYRVLSAQWSRQYRTILLSDQDLSREARWGEESDVRFTSGVSELRMALRNAFGDECAIDSRWRDEPGEEEDREWCERTRDAWIAGGARGDGRFAARKEKTVNAWAARKAKKRAEMGSAREVSNNGAQ